jgi:single-stranded DNA-binding protein
MAQTAFHGNIGKVKEPAFSNEGQCRLSFTVAEGHSRFDKQSKEWKDTGTTWRRVTVFGKRAETLADVLREGAKQQVVVIGREETREWTNDDGTTGSGIEVVADIVGLIPSAKQANNSGGGNWGGNKQASADTWGTGGAETEPPF